MPRIKLEHFNSHISFLKPKIEGIINSQEMGQPGGGTGTRILLQAFIEYYCSVLSHTEKAVPINRNDVIPFFSTLEVSE